MPAKTLLILKVFTDALHFPNDFYKNNAMQNKHLTKKLNKKYFQGISLFNSATTFTEVNQLKRLSITESEKLTHMFFVYFKQFIRVGKGYV